MTKARAAFVFAGFLAACGGSTEWDKRPIESRSAKVDGVAFSIEVPQGMRLRERDKEVALDFLEKKGGEDYVFTPEVTIRVQKGKVTLEDELKYEKSPIMNKETFDGGWVLSMENSYYKGKEDYLVRGAKIAGDRTITCSARVTPWVKGETVKEKIPLVEKMCKSIRVL